MDPKSMDNKPPTAEELEEAEALLHLMQSPKPSPFAADHGHQAEEEKEAHTPPNEDTNVALLVGAFAVGIGLVAVWYFYTSSGVSAVKDAPPTKP